MKVSTIAKVLKRAVTLPLQHPSSFIKMMPFSASPTTFAISLQMFEDIVHRNQYHTSLIKQGDVVVDAGANVGLFAQMAVRRGAQVYAFEPDPNIFPILQNKSSKDLLVFPMGLGDVCAEKELHIARLSGSSSFAIESDNLYVANKKIPIITIDSLGIPVNFIKMDTEGYEKEILKGAAETIKKYKPIIIMSAYHFASDKEEIPKLLQSIAPYLCKKFADGEEELLCTPI